MPISKPALSARQTLQKEHYNRIADEYDRRYKRENSNHLYKINEISSCFFDHLKISSPGPYRFMEVGCGTGIHAYHFLAAHDPQIERFVLTDLSEEMLGRARARLLPFSNKTEFKITPAENIATDAVFDGIYVSGAMHHFSDPQKFLTEVKKCLKPGGMLVICEPIVSNPINLVKALLAWREDSGQFRVTRKNTRRLLKTLGYTLKTDRILHYKSDHPAIRHLFPHEKLENIRGLDWAGVMFLLAATA